MNDMNKTHRSHSSRGLILSVLVGVALGGCSAPSVLITPVSGRRVLVETELSRDSLFASDKIVIIDVSGVIINAPRPQFLGTGEHPVSLLLEQLDKARRDRRVKGVLLRINSPGGTVGASELMHDEILYFKKSGKPIVAVMMDVAASGGYYIACACDEIIAQSSTITGSIGVIMQLFDVTGIMKFIGIESNAITSGVHKDAGSPFRAMKPDERALFQAIVEDMFDRFVDVVVQGRPKLDESEVRRLADGRVYTARQALEAGLIDRIAPMREAILAVKRKAGVKRMRLVSYSRPYTFRPNYYARSPATEINLIKTSLGLPSTTPRFMYLWQPGLP